MDNLELTCQGTNRFTVKLQCCNVAMKILLLVNSCHKFLLILKNFLTYVIFARSPMMLGLNKNTKVRGASYKASLILGESGIQ